VHVKEEILFKGGKIQNLSFLPSNSIQRTSDMKLCGVGTIGILSIPDKIGQESL
jgi:hypothetical protein